MPPTETRSAPRPRGAGVRQTEPQGYSPYANGGFGVIPRRGAQTHYGDLRDFRGIERVACSSPLRLLKLLPDVHPLVGKALDDVLLLSCAPGDLQIVAVKPGGGADDVDPEGTAAITALWESLPDEIGGLAGLQTQLTQEAMLTGLVCAEGVPGARGMGLAEVWPIDSLTVGFRRVDGALIPLQRQVMPKDGAKYQGFQQLNPATFFWSAIHPMVDEPYGRAPYAPAVAECLEDIALLKDLRDAVHNAAWTRLGHGIDFKELHQYATNDLGMKEPDASKWVQDRFAEAVAAYSKLRADDAIVYDSAGKLEQIQGGDFRGMEPIMAFLRQRITTALKTLPTLMGINDGSTQTYTSVEWKIYATGLESRRTSVAAVLCRLANLHLQLLGKPLKAIAKVKSIQTSDALIDARTKSVEIANAKELVRMGLRSIDEISVELTGSGPVAEPMPGAFDAPSQPAPTAPDPTPAEERQA